MMNGVDSFVYEICRNGFVDSKIYIKHDGENLLVAFVFSGIPDSTLVIPEIFIDSKCDQSENWQEDDFWFHVSAQDCYAVGKREDYSNCRPDYLVWRASPNYPLGENYEVFDAIECSVPFALIGIEPGQKIGLCPSLSIHPQNKRFNWPITAHEDKPSSWATFKIWE